MEPDTAPAQDELPCAATLRVRLARSVMHAEAKMAAPGMDRVQRVWCLLSEDLERGYYLCDLYDRRMKTDIDDQGSVVAAQMSTLIVAIARHSAMADRQLRWLARRARLLRGGVIGLVVAAIVVALYVFVFTEVEDPVAKFFAKALDELSKESALNALFFVGLGAALLHQSERRRGLPDALSRIAVAVPWLVAFLGGALIMGFHLAQDLDQMPSRYLAGGSRAAFDFFCLGLGIGGSYLVRLRRKWVAKTA